MPYISKKMRHDDMEYLVNRLMTVIADHCIAQETPNEDLAKTLTYVIFKMLKGFYVRSENYPGWYFRMDALKVLDSCRDEFKRRFLHAYENEAMNRNGDVSRWVVTGQ